jgi:tRNA(fMet)-specific endonuclease VapC
VTRFLLDANVLSDAIRRTKGPVALRLAEVRPEARCTSIIVASELLFGARKKGLASLAARVDGLLKRIAVLPFEAPADLRYADLRVSLARAGTPIGAMDMLIAAHALALDCILVTANEREFRRVPDLRVENWLA